MYDRTFVEDHLLIFSIKAETTVSVQTIESTHPARTVTIASGIDKTLTVTPSTETVTSTLSFIRTLKKPTFTITDVVATVTAPCSKPDWDPQADRLCTYRPNRLDLGPIISRISDLLPGRILADRAIGMDLSCTMLSAPN